MRRFLTTLALAACAACAVHAQTGAPAGPSSGPDAAAIRQQLQAYYFDAARRGDVAMLKEFVASRYDLQTRDDKGYTALILAAYHGHEPAVRLLLDAGADPCAEDKRGNTALMGAIFKGEFAISRLLMKASCDPNHRNRAGQTPAMYAALFGRVEVLHALSEKGADLKATDGEGNSAESLQRGELAAPGSKGLAR
jgi:hypothetical protein